MAEQKDKKTHHLRSARQWLTRAEESFDKDRDIRGELDLFLAQAELERAKERGQSQVWLKKYPALRHGLAILFAVTLASAGYGVYNQSNESVALEPAQPVVSPHPVPQLAPADNVVANEPSPAIGPHPAATRQTDEPAASPVPVRVKTAEKRMESIPAETRRQEIPVSSDEMKNLIRAAGKSLRGE